MNNLVKYSVKFLKRNGSTILTCLGGAGVVVTSVMTAKATTKAFKLLEETKEEKGEDLSVKEIIKVTGPVYIPAVITGAATISCIFGANILNQRKQAALTSAYALLDQSYKNYKKKVDELYGEGSDREIKDELAKDKYEENKYPLEGNKRLFYDEFSERYFESTTEDLLRAENELNRIANDMGGAYLNDFYDLIGLDPVDFGDYLGWSTCELYETYWSSWIHFEHSKAIMDDGLEVTIVTITTEPTFGFEDY